MRHGSHQMTTLILAHKDDNAILEPSALCVFSALVNNLYCTDMYCEWVSCLHSPVDFLEFLPGNRNHHHFSDDVLPWAPTRWFATATLKMKTLAAAFPVTLCSTAVQFSGQHRNRSFLLLRIADLVVDVDDVLNVSFSKIVEFPPSERLAF